MTPRRQRMLAVGLVGIGVVAAAALTLTAMRDNMMFFIDVSDVVAGEYPADRNFRVGGLVVNESVHRVSGSLEMTFRVTDLECELPVSYTGVVPDLFAEGQGVVAHGRMGANGEFVADEILAKHDENYMSPEVAESLADHLEEKTRAAVGSGECNQA
ncbi:MAG: cytochrome c maturation protein CcmE [Pseudomonadota bacterium]